MAIAIDEGSAIKVALRVALLGLPSRLAFDPGALVNGSIRVDEAPISMALIIGELANVAGAIGIALLAGAIDVALAPLSDVLAAGLGPHHVAGAVALAIGEGADVLVAVFVDLLAKAALLAVRHLTAVGHKQIGEVLDAIALHLSFFELAFIGASIGPRQCSDALLLAGLPLSVIHSAAGHRQGASALRLLITIDLAHILVSVI